MTAGRYLFFDYDAAGHDVELRSGAVEKARTTFFTDSVIRWHSDRRCPKLASDKRSGEYQILMTATLEETRRSHSRMRVVECPTCVKQAAADKAIEPPAKRSGRRCFYCGSAKVTVMGTKRPGNVFVHAHGMPTMALECKACGRFGDLHRDRE